MTAKHPTKKRVRYRTTEERRRLEATAKVKRPHRMLTEKCCKQCGQVKDAKNFDYTPTMVDGMRAVCRDCLRPQVTIRARKYRERLRANNPNFRARDRINHRRRLYGVTPEMFDEMLHGQGGGCAICQYCPLPEERPLNIDHNHWTGAVRGLLCNNCNTGISRFKDNLELLEGAKQYLLKYGQLKMVA